MIRNYYGIFQESRMIWMEILSGKFNEFSTENSMNFFLIKNLWINSVENKIN